MLPNKHFIPLAMLEGLLMFTVAIRTALPEQHFDFNDRTHLGWMVATIFMGSTALALFVVRNAGLRTRITAGENVDDEQKQYFFVSLAVLAAAGLLSLAGPQAVARLLQ